MVIEAACAGVKTNMLVDRRPRAVVGKQFRLLLINEYRFITNDLWASDSSLYAATNRQSVSGSLSTVFLKKMIGFSFRICVPLRIFLVAKIPTPCAGMNAYLSPRGSAGIDGA